MPEIRLLDSSVINLIAAGEVVDRPASAVKEMVENAIDAGASHITVEIRRGGLEMIRVSDDGCGMSADNARRAFLKHATSKIRSEEDLNKIGTLGFRGEALAAISAVSKITLTTKENSASSGTRFEVAEGTIVSEEECGCPDGSCFTVENLFFNTPARLKFMKSEPAEAGAVQSVMERLSLSHPNISFRLISNGSERFHTPGNNKLPETVFAVFGKEFAEMSLPAQLKTGEISVSGLVGKPVYSKANRSRQIFFLNGRYVRSPILTSGLESSYHNKMLIGRVPVCVLFIEMPVSAVDVNVHPSKLEVKFADENGVAYAVRRAVEDALAKDNGILQMRVNPPAQSSVTTPSPIKATVAKLPESPEHPAKKESAKPVERTPISTPVAKPQIPAEETPKLTSMPEKPTSKPVEKSGWTITPPAEKKQGQGVKIEFHDVIQPRTATQPPPPPSIVNIPHIVETPKEKPRNVDTVQENTPVIQQEEPVLFQTEQAFRLIGEAFDCYVLIEKGEEILFLDKHALHERINFERLRKSDIPSQSLLQPIILHLGIDENRVLTENADFLSRFGFILESFGDDLLIREIPALIDPEQAEPLLQQFADSLAIGRDESLMDRFYYDIACKASIRSGSKTSSFELQQLIAEYFRREKELQYCPHGRPIVFSLTKKSVEKQFKRVK